MSNIHGGDITGYMEEYGARPLDYSANISPLGLPEAVKEGVIHALERTEEYPDPLCRILCKNIASYEKVDENNTICGNGAADIIYRLVYAHQPKKALILAPTFAEYEAALLSWGCEVVYHLLQKENDFLITETILDALTADMDMIFLCQPNNPTGQVCEKPLLERIGAKCEALDILMVVDECFVEFLEEPNQYSMVSYIDTHPNLFVLKAFTKMYAMAGIRLGYGLNANQELLGKMRQMGQPWGVSLLAQEAGVIALAQTAYVEEVKQLIKEERLKLVVGLRKLGLKVYEGHANYIFFYSKDKLLHMRLRVDGILIRDCANYRGLGPGYYRIAVRQAKDNEVLLQRIEQALQKWEV